MTTNCSTFVVPTHDCSSNGPRKSHWCRISVQGRAPAVVQGRKHCDKVEATTGAREPKITKRMGACEKCKPDKPETHEQVVDDTGCTASYESVKKCMKEHQGNISDCIEEWTRFKSCFAEKKYAEGRGLGSSEMK